MRDKIILKSVDLFLSYGFKSVTMDDIANALGMSKKTILLVDDDPVILITVKKQLEQYEFDKVFLLNSENELKPPLSHLEAMSCIGHSHIWNHMLYAKVLSKFCLKVLNLRSIHKSSGCHNI